MRPLLVFCIFIRTLASISSAANPADSAWSQLKELEDKANEKVPLGANAVDFYAGREKALHDAAAEFVKQFSNDAHVAQAMLWKIQMTDFPGSTEQRIALLRQNELDAGKVVDDTSLPPDLRLQLQRTILTQWLDNPDLITTVNQANEIEGRIADLLRRNPAEPKAITFQLA